MTGDPAQDVNRDPDVGRPGEPDMPQVMADQVLVTELPDYLVPVRRIAENGSADPSVLKALITCGARRPGIVRADGLATAARTLGDQDGSSLVGK